MVKYIIYQTTCVVNNKFYIGQHKCKKADDTYLGSGILLKKALKKYGKNNFIREILHICKNEKELNKKEKEIVNEDLLKIRYVII